VTRVLTRLAELDCADIVARASRAHALPAEVIFSASRERHVADARARVVYEVAERLGPSDAALGRLFGVDRSTAVGAVRRWARICGEAWAR